MAESTFETESGPVGANGFEFEPNREGELPVETSTVQIIEEVPSVEQPLAQIVEANAMVTSSSPRERIVSKAAKLAFHTPLVTKSALDLTARFY